MKKIDYAHGQISGIIQNPDGTLFTLQMRVSLVHEDGKLYIRRCSSFRHETWPNDTPALREITDIEKLQEKDMKGLGVGYEKGMV